MRAHFAPLMTLSTALGLGENFGVSDVLLNTLSTTTETFLAVLYTILFSWLALSSVKKFDKGPVASLHPVFVNGHKAFWTSGGGYHKAVFFVFFGQGLPPVFFAVRHFGLPCRVSVKGNDVPVEEESLDVLAAQTEVLSQGGWTDRPS